MKVLGDSLKRHPGDLIYGLPGELDELFKSRCCVYVEVITLYILRHHVLLAEVLYLLEK